MQYLPDMYLSYRHELQINQTLNTKSRIWGLCLQNRTLYEDIKPLPKTQLKILQPT